MTMEGLVCLKCSSEKTHTSLPKWSNMLSIVFVKRPPVREKLLALKLIIQSDEAKFRLLTEGPAVLNMKSFCPSLIF